MITEKSSSLARKRRAWQQLSEPEQILLVKAFCLFPLIAIGLSLFGLQRLQRMLTQRADSAIPIRSALPVETTTQLVEIAARYTPLWANCLKRSLVLWYLLRQQGRTSQLRIGVRREQGVFQAHAWVEYQNRVLNDTPTIRQQFAAFETAIEVKMTPK